MMMKLDIRAFGLSLGIIWAIGSFLLGILATLSGQGKEIVDIIGSFYIGYAATIKGSLIGAVWAFIDAFIGGALLAWLYNKVAK
jgi:hypothetical protein